MKITICFNSKMVQLKEKFIARNQGWFRKFQFQNGSIKRQMAQMPGILSSCFNSKMVQLKGQQQI